MAVITIEVPKNEEISGRKNNGGDNVSILPKYAGGSSLYARVYVCSTINLQRSKNFQKF